MNIKWVQKFTVLDPKMLYLLPLKGNMLSRVLSADENGQEWTGNATSSGSHNSFVEEFTAEPLTCVPQIANHSQVQTACSVPFHRISQHCTTTEAAETTCIEHLLNRSGIRFLTKKLLERLCSIQVHSTQLYALKAKSKFDYENHFQMECVLYDHREPSKHKIK